MSHSKEIYRDNMTLRDQLRDVLVNRMLKQVVTSQVRPSLFTAMFSNFIIIVIIIIIIISGGLFSGRDWYG
jgi:hypothetical protein